MSVDVCLVILSGGVCQIGVLGGAVEGPFERQVRHGLNLSDVAGNMNDRAVLDLPRTVEITSDPTIEGCVIVCELLAGGLETEPALLLVRWQSVEVWPIRGEPYALVR